MPVCRRSLFGMAAGAALAVGARAAGAKNGAEKNRSEKTPHHSVASITAGAQPISKEEHAARIARLQSLMQERAVGALLVEAGSSLQYFTGIEWHRSERTTAAVIPAEGP